MRGIVECVTGNLKHAEQKGKVRCESLTKSSTASRAEAAGPGRRCHRPGLPRLGPRVDAAEFGRRPGRDPVTDAYGYNWDRVTDAHALDRDPGAPCWIDVPALPVRQAAGHA